MTFAPKWIRTVQDFIIKPVKNSPVANSNHLKMNKHLAISLDKGYFVKYDEDHKWWYVVGNESNFHYTSHMLHEQAEDRKERMEFDLSFKNTTT